MAQLSIHVNVLRLFDVMESIQDSKCTLFLVLELAKGGELFDRIAIDQGASEEVAKNYLGQLLEGLQHCHAQGVCHRDLKPENLLLADDDGCLLKIADFGLSATFRNVDEPLRGGATPLTRTLQSVVGSPFYVAPEVLASQGYDGSKADVWSVGVILYAMLAGNLPFGKDLAVCVRFAKFKQWIETQPLSAPPTWLFPAKASEDVKALLVSMLNPNPTFRISVQEALEHKWVGKKKAEIPPGPPIDKTHSPPSGLYQMLAADCSQSAASPSPTRKASRPMDMFSSPPISNESRNGSPRLESLICDPTDVLEKQLGAIDLRICRKRRKSYPPSGPSGSTGGIDEASGVSSSLPADYKADQSYLIPDQSAACMTPPRMIEEQVVGTPNGSLWSLESPSPHNGSFLMDMFRANANKGAEEPPAFVDHVRRSTRFVTSLPAAEVLGGIEDIINSGAIPLPPPFELQETHMCWDDFRLEVRWDSVLVYSVHVFLLMGEEDSSRCDYLVEFRRGQMEIFDFKRYYETVLERLSRYIKDDPRVLDYRATGVLPDSSTGFSFFPFSDE